jgi:hypothetical protein
MANTMRIVKGIVLLVMTAFVVMVVGGVYTALDAAPAYTLASSTGASGEDGIAPSEQNGAAAAGAAQTTGDVTSGAAVSASSGAAETEGIGFRQQGQTVASSPDASASGAQSNTTSGSTDPGSASVSAGSGGDASSVGSGSGGDSASASAGSGGGSSSVGSGSDTSGSNASVPAPVTPPAKTEPQKTYHPAWDEYVEEGHWEESVREATYGERPVYGAVCNQCGQIIVGNPNQHLKDTHHSGWHEDVVGYETYEITPAKNERFWVDTSHWIHHPESWT